MAGKINEACGVFGLYSPHTQALADTCYYGLFALQHRGQESCGIAVNDQGLIQCYRDQGLVSEVFTDRVMNSLPQGQLAIAHVRYSTTGLDGRRNAQPLVVNHVKGVMALAHNGALTNAAELREELEMSGGIFQTSSDTEVISYIITRERIKSSSIEEAISSAMGILQGAYSLVVMSATKLIGVRDPHGFRPLCLGEMDDGTQILASESCAIRAVGGHFVRDILPGEIVVIDKAGTRSLNTHVDTKPKSTCLFEYIYFARPDSVIDGASVHLARQRAGELLAIDSPVDADLVIGVPDSGLDAALGFSRASGIPYSIGFIKNKYIARTFIQPTQDDREQKVGIKLSPLEAVIKGKRIVLVDDSIVRGTTIARIVGQLKQAGATAVHVCSSAPAFKHPCYFGTDIDSADKLIANHHSAEEIARIMGADSLSYLSHERMHELTGEVKGFCTGCFTGKYPVPSPRYPGKNRFEQKLLRSVDHGILL